mgnify:CR=1 FL=1
MQPIPAAAAALASTAGSFAGSLDLTGGADPALDPAACTGPGGRSCVHRIPEHSMAMVPCVDDYIHTPEPVQVRTTPSSSLSLSVCPQTNS